MVKGHLSSNCCSRLPNGSYREDGTTLFSEVHSGRVRGNRHKLPREKFQLDIRKIPLSQ